MANISAIKLPSGNTYNLVDKTSGYVTTDAIPTKTSDLTNDSDFITGMTILSYGGSTWQNFIDAYNANKVVYCRASSSSNPASGSQTRLAFMAYVNNATTPTEVEFQYYRSVSTHTASQQGDQVFVYKLNKTSGWSVTTREASVKVVAGTGLGGTYRNGTMTLTGPTKVSDLTNDSGFITDYTETDPVFSASAAAGIIASDITNWNYAYSGYDTLQWNNTSKEMRASKQGSMTTLFAQSDMAYNSSSNTSGFLTISDISTKSDKSATVSTITYDSTNKKITKTINGTTTDVVSVATLKTALGSMPASDVYSWAKASSKPTYTASEVGALPSSTTIPAITLNGSASTSPSFYAPTAAGTSGNVLTSSGSGAPSWSSIDNLLPDKDFVKERGTSSSWYYRKWNSGKIEAWTTYNAGSQTPSKWTDYMYYKDLDITIPSGIFSVAPNHTVATNNGSDYKFMVHTARATSATNIRVRCVKPNSDAAKPVIALYVSNMSN